MTLLWMCLVLAFVAMLAVFAVVLFRKLIALLQGVSDLIATTAILDGAHRADDEPRPLPAALAGIEAATARWREVRRRRVKLRAERRSRRVARGHRLVNTDAASIEWFRR